jgi:hypothetical protein
MEREAFLVFASRTGPHDRSRDSAIHGHRTGGHVNAVEVDHTPLASAPDPVVAIITEAVADVAKALLDPDRIGRHV